MSENNPFRVAIIGGGIVGTVLALALNQRKISVKLYERNSSLSEISAAMGLNASALEAVKVCGSDAYDATKEVLTQPSNPDVGLKFVDGYSKPSKGGWQVPWDGILSGVHRGQLLESLLKRVPEGIIQYDKRLDSCDEGDGKGPVRLNFADGTTAFADAVIGADGIGSHVRRYLLGEQHPAARARYAHSYVYRAVMDIKDAIGLVEQEYTEHTTMWLGKDAHLVTAPVGRGHLLGVTGLVHDRTPWPSEHHMVLPATKEDVINRFQDWNPQIRALIDKIKPGAVDRWGLFDLEETPLPYYAKGRVALVGDAAHASTPHLGSGAMCGMEDAAVLAELLADEHIQGKPEHVKAALEAYSQIRLPRGEFILHSSREAGNAFDFRHPEAKDNMEEIEKVVMAKYRQSWSQPVHEHVSAAKQDLVRRLGEL